MVTPRTLLERLNFKLILIIVFLLPLTGIAGLNILGELKADASAHILILSLFFYLPYILIRQKIGVPKNITFYLFLIFIIWIFIASLVSFPNYTYVFKERSGINKFVLQFSLLFFYAVPVTIYFYHIISLYDKNYVFRKIRRVVLWSFYLVSIYGSLEILHIYGFTFMEPFLKIVDSIIRDEPEFKFVGLGRIRSLSPEPPFLAMYLAFSTPWLLSYFLTGEKKIARYVLLGIIMTLTYYSGSRSGLIIIISEIIIFGFLVLRRRFHKKYLKKIILVIPFLFLSTVTIGISIGDKLIDKINSIFISTESQLQVSSISRWGTQRAAIEIAKENPIFGVGFGQQGFYLPTYYPQWAVEGSYEIRNWKSNDPQQAWPPGFSMITRLFAETGLIGVFLFIIVNLSLLYKLVKAKYQVNNKETNAFIVVTLTCLSGLLINYLQFDSFRLTSYWLIIAIAMVMVKKQNLN